MPSAPVAAKNTPISRRRLPPGLNRRVLLFLCHSLLFHIALSTVGIALSMAATAWTTSLPLLALSRFARGACFGANRVVKPPFMVALTDRRAILLAQSGQQRGLDALEYGLVRRDAGIRLAAAVAGLSRHHAAGGGLRAVEWAEHSADGAAERLSQRAAPDFSPSSGRASANTARARAAYGRSLSTCRLSTGWTSCRRAANNHTSRHIRHQGSAQKCSRASA